MTSSNLSGRTPVGRRYPPPKWLGVAERRCPGLWMSRPCAVEIHVRGYRHTPVRLSSSERNGPRRKAVALGRGEGPLVAVSIRDHGARPWHWEVARARL